MIDPNNPAPFLVGFIPTLVYTIYGVANMAWTGRNNVHDPFAYDSDIRQACAYARQTNWHWLVIVAAPFVAGAVVYCAWWLIYLLTVML